MVKELLGLALVVVIGAGGDALLAQGKAKSKGHGANDKVKAEKVQVKNDKVKTHPGQRGEARDRDVVIDHEGHRRAIVDYYREGLPPGLAKRSELPPGLRRQLRERGTLPPGLQKYWTPVPDSLARRLPPIPANSRRYFVGHDLVVVDHHRNEVLRLIPDVLPHHHR